MKFRSSHLSSCVFCRIVDGKERNPILHKDESYTVFSDIRPASKHHLLVVTNEHIRDVTCLEGTSHVVDEMVAVAKNLLEKDNVDMDDVRVGFHVPPLVSVYHIHLHVIWPWSAVRSMLKWKYKRKSAWFWTPLVAKQWLQEREAKNQSAGASAAAKRPSQPKVSQRADSEDDVEEVTGRLGRMSTKD